MLATVTWTGAGDGINWSNVANWSTGALPGSADDVVINSATSTILHASGNDTIHSLSSAKALTLSGGSLTVSTTITVGAAFTLSGGTLAGGALQSGTTLILTYNGGALNSLTVASGATIDATETSPSGVDEATVTGGLTLNGTIDLGSSNGSYAGQVYFSATQTLSGTGTVVFGGSGNNAIEAQGTGPGNTAATLTVASGLALSGGAGRISGYYSNDTTVNNTTLTFSSGTLTFTGTNNGLINANSGTLTVNGTNWVNNGTITVTNGVVSLGGSFTPAALGHFNASGTTVNLTGTLNNSGNTFTLASGLGSTWYLEGGAINGGTLASSGPDLVLTYNGGTLNSLTVASGATIDATESSPSGIDEATVTGGLTLNGTIDLGSSNGSYAGQVYFSATQTLSGTGTVVFGGSGNNAIEAQGTGPGNTAATLTVASGLALSGGAGRISGYYSNDTTVNNTTLTFSSGTLTFTGTNNGLINANSGTLTVNGTNWVNNGTITVTNGVVSLGGSFTPAALGHFNASGTTVNLTGTLNNSGNTFTLASGLGSTWYLEGGAINGGTLASSGPDLVLTYNGGTLNSLTVASGATIDATESSPSGIDEATVTGGLTLNGTIDLGSSNGTYAGQVYFSATQTLSGTGTVVFSGSGNNAIEAQGTGPGNTAATLTVASGLALSGGAGRIGGYYSNDTFVNDTTVTFSSGTLNLSGANWVNNGTITVTSGVVGLGGSFTPAALGHFNASGATVDLTGTLNNSGNTFTLASGLGTWYLIGGAINGGTLASSGPDLILTYNGGALNSLTVASGATIDATETSPSGVDEATVTGGLTLNGTIDLGSSNGSYAGQVYFSATQTLSGTGTVVFGGSGNNAIEAQGTGPGNTAATLTVASGLALSGGAGRISGYYSNDTTVNNTTLTFSSGTLTFTGTNNGLINANSGTLTVNGTNWVNNGTITVTNGVVSLGGSFTPAALGHFNASGTTVNLTGTLNNSGNTFTLASGLGSTWYLEGGAINGGTLASSGPDLVLTYNGGTLNSLTVASGATIDATESSPSGIDEATVTGGLTLNGTIDLGSSNGTYAGQVYFSATQTLSGTGTVVFSGSGNNAIEAQGTGPGNTAATLTVASGLALSGGAGRIGGYYSNDTFVNDTTVTFSSGTLNLSGANWVNNGTITVTSGVVGLGGSFTPAALGHFNASGATVDLTGTLNNSGNTFTLASGLGTWYLIGGAINGGTLASSGPDLILTYQGGMLNSLTVASGATIDATESTGSIQNNATVTGGLTLNGTIDLGSSSGSYYGQLYFAVTQSLSGTGSIVFGGSTSNEVYAQGTGTGGTAATLTVGSGITVELGNGSLKGYYSNDVVIFNGTYLYLATRLVVTGQPPATVTASSGFGVTVTAENALGALATGFFGNVTIALATNPGSSFLGGLTVVSAVSGVAVFTGLTLNNAGNGYSFSATSGTVTVGTSSTFNVVPVVPTRLVVMGEPPATVAAGGGFNVVVAAEDGSGDVDTSFSGTATLTFGANPGGSSLGGSTTATFSGGFAVLSSLNLNRPGTGYTLDVATSGLASATTSSINVVPAAATQLIIASEPTTISAGTGFTVTVDVEDVYGNIVTGFSGNVIIVLANNPGGSTLGGSLTVVVIDGVAIFENLTLNIVSTNYTLDVTSGTLASATSTALQVMPGAATQLIIESQPTSIASGTDFNVTVDIEDAEGNIATGYSGNVTIVLVNNPGGSTLGGTRTVVVIDGVAIFVDLTLNIVSTNYTLDVASGTLASATSTALQVTPGAATQLVIFSQPTSVTAGADFNVTIDVEDADGNIATGYSGSVTIVLVNNPGNSTLGGTLIVSVTNGVAIFVNLTLNKVSTDYTLDVSSGSLASATSTALHVTPGTPTQLIIVSTQQPRVTKGAGFGITVDVEDAEGNVATGFSGSVTVAISTNPGSSTLGGSTTVTTISGVAIFTGLTLNSTGSGYTLLFSNTGGLTSATFGPFSVTPAGEAIELIVAEPPPTSVVAGTGFSIDIEAVDGFGTLDPTFTGTVALTLANNPGNSTLGGTVSVTVNDGLASFSGSTLNKAGVGYTLQASNSLLMSATTAPLTVDPGIASQLIVTNGPPTSVSAGAAFIVIVDIEDAEGNTVTTFGGNVTIAIANNPGSSTLAGTLIVAASSGAASFSDLTLNKVGVGYTLQASSNQLSSVTTTVLTVIPGSASLLVFTSEPPSSLSAGAAFSITVTVEDAEGNVVTNFSSSVTIAIANNPSNGALGGTLTITAANGVAVFSELSINNAGSGYTLIASGSGLTTVTTNSIDVGAITLTITGTLNELVVITFFDATHFTVTINGGTPTPYTTATIDKVVYNGPPTQFSELIFIDLVTTDDYTATQTLSSTAVIRQGSVDFELDVNLVAYLYVYVADPSCTATVTVTAGTGSNYFVGAANGGYGYIADPVLGIYSELSGFPSLTVSGTSGTYAYLYSTSHGAFVGDPGGSSFTASGIAVTLNDFPQVYAVGAADGTDTMTLHTEGGSFVGQPSFSYVSGTFNGASFLIGALFAANVTTEATHATDPAFFYSYAADTFNGAQSTSSLTGSATGFASFSTFVSQATGFQSASVLESGGGTDVANLTSPGNGTFIETGTASTLAVGGVTMITVNTFYSDNGALVAVPSKVNITGNANGSDTANLYDSTGTNVLIAQGNKATLATAVSTAAVTQFGKVNAYDQNGTNDSVREQTIDFALQTVGNWTSV